MSEIQAYELTKEMEMAIKHLHLLQTPLFITGKAGAGKTTFLKHIVSSLQDEMNIVVSASTGVAAVNAGGVTLHSLFRLPLHIISPDTPVEFKLAKHKIKLLRSIDVLIIDEVSMIRPDIIDYIDKTLKFWRGNGEVFGGVKVVFFGDLFQLPPVLTAKDIQILSKWYRCGYFFAANVFQKHDLHVIELSKVFRQTDEKFIRILNNIRNYTVTEQDLIELMQTADSNKAKVYDDKAIHLCSLKRTVEEINKEMLGKPSHTFEAAFIGKFAADAIPCDKTLELKVGARVMMIANDTENHQYYNGSLGTIENIFQSRIQVRIDETNEVVSVEKYIWKKYDYEIEGNKVTPVEVGQCKQFPITLAWAVTIHKSQGLTFDNVVIHAKNVFASGQIYVALSRCRRLEGIVTDSYITMNHIYQDPWLIWFEQMYKQYKGIFRFKT